MIQARPRRPLRPPVDEWQLKSALLRLLAFLRDPPLSLPVLPDSDLSVRSLLPPRPPQVPARGTRRLRRLMADPAPESDLRRARSDLHVGGRRAERNPVRKIAKRPDTIVSLVQGGHPASLRTRTWATIRKLFDSVLFLSSKGAAAAC
uniref:Uncharacterized protein n=1 Tax=Oryza brachyantha TaxID=4533 RepID=J3LTU3_ORYBR